MVAVALQVSDQHPKPIGKGYGGFNLYPVAPKRYACKRCGHEVTLETNSYQPVVSYGHYNSCPKCPPWAKYPEFGGQTVWMPLENDPAESGEESYTESLLQEADELLPRASSSTLVIHLEDPSTDFLKGIYAGKGYDVINGRVDPAALLVEVRNHDRIFMLGHGGPHGLFGAGFSLGGVFGRELAEKEDGLYIWCHAVEYAHEYKLSGLVSGMFISEVGEAAHEGIQATQEQIDASNNAFVRAVRRFLDTGSSPHEVRACYNDPVCKVTQYNNERLYVMRKGRILDTLGQEQPDETSAKPGSPRYWRHSEPQTGAYGDLDEPPDEFKQKYGWEGEEIGFAATSGSDRIEWRYDRAAGGFWFSKFWIDPWTRKARKAIKIGFRRVPEDRIERWLQAAAARWNDLGWDVDYLENDSY